MTTAHALGTRLRQLRKSRQLTLSALASLSGVAVSTISKIENGALSPTLDKVLRLANGLDLSIGQLIGEEEVGSGQSGPNSRLLPARGNDGIVIDTQNYEYRYLCAELTNKQMVPIHARIKAADLNEFGPLERHGGEEFLIVLTGEIEVHTEFYAPIRLSRGESIYLDSTMGHAYVSVGEQEAEVCCVCTEPLRVAVRDQIDQKSM